MMISTRLRATDTPGLLQLKHELLYLKHYAMLLVAESGFEEEHAYKVCRLVNALLSDLRPDHKYVKLRPPVKELYEELKGRLRFLNHPECWRSEEELKDYRDLMQRLGFSCIDSAPERIRFLGRPDCWSSEEELKDYRDLTQRGGFNCIDSALERVERLKQREQFILDYATRLNTQYHLGLPVPQDILYKGYALGYVLPAAICKVISVIDYRLEQGHWEDEPSASGGGNQDNN